MSETQPEEIKPQQHAVVSKSDSNIAFEESFPEDAPQELWRLSSVRHFKTHDIPHINWFATEAAAITHRDWISDGRGRVLSLTKYRSC